MRNILRVCDVSVAEKVLEIFQKVAGAVDVNLSSNDVFAESESF